MRTPPVYACLSYACLVVVFGQASVRAQEKSQPLSPALSPLHYGIDTYLGASNAPGLRRLTDQFWAGQATFTPSVAYVRWENTRGRAARLALGIGQASTAADPVFRQPVEAWWKQPVGAGTITAGRFFAGFGSQEWQYESKEGLQWEQSIGRFSLNAALQKDRKTQQGNLYARGGFSLGEEGTVGISLGAGRGFSYGTNFNAGVGLDARLPLERWTLSGEANQFSSPGGGHFRFAMSKVSFEATQSVSPFVSYYNWRDTSEEQSLGSFRSTILGFNWQATQTLSLETAVARAGRDNIAWLQFHYAWER